MAGRSFSRRFVSMGTESGMQYLTEAKRLEAEGTRIVHLEIGEPHFGSPPVAVDAAAEALRAGATHYGPAAGLPELRNALARDTSRWSGIGLTAANVTVVPGTKIVVLAALVAFTEPGDEIVVFDPGFPAYASLARLCGCTVRAVPLRAENAFRPDPAEIRSAVGPRTRLLFANWPHNPTGSVLRSDDAAAIGAIAREHDLLVVSDELYRGLSFVDDATSLFAAMGDLDHCILVDGFSKRWAMTGWRLGYSVSSESVATAVAAVTTNTATCAATYSQLGAIAALEHGGEWQRGMLAELRRLRHVAVATLASEGFPTPDPPGGLYVFPRVAGADSRELARSLMRSGVATMPGAAFGPTAKEHVRLTFSVPEPDLVEGLRLFARELTTAHAS